MLKRVLFTVVLVGVMSGVSFAGSALSWSISPNVVEPGVSTPIEIFLTNNSAGDGTGIDTVALDVASPDSANFDGTNLGLFGLAFTLDAAGMPFAPPFDGSVLLGPTPTYVFGYNPFPQSASSFGNPFIHFLDNGDSIHVATLHVTGVLGGPAPTGDGGQTFTLRLGDIQGGTPPVFLGDFSEIRDFGNSEFQEIRVTPEPATAALLLIGGFAALRRRRS